jgi:hypothetical protein
MDDGPPDIDRSAMFAQRVAHCVDGPGHTRAEPPRRCQENMQTCLRGTVR